MISLAGRSENLILVAILAHLETLWSLAAMRLPRIGPLVVVRGVLGSREGIVAVHCLHICQIDVFCCDFSHCECMILCRVKIKFN